MPSRLYLVVGYLHEPVLHDFAQQRDLERIESFVRLAGLLLRYRWVGSSRLFLSLLLLLAALCVLPLPSDGIPLLLLQRVDPLQ